MLISYASAMSATRLPWIQPFQGRSMIQTSIACCSRYGRYCFEVIRLSHEAMGVLVESLICRNAAASHMSHSIHCIRYGSSSLPIRCTPSVLKL